MKLHIGVVAALYRYPVKSLAGESLDDAEVGWHGVAGDRRLAFRRVEDRGGVPWLTASKLPELILYVPLRLGSAMSGDLPTHVRTPEGRELAVFSQELSMEISRQHGSAVEIMHLNRGIFDEASISTISSATIKQIGHLAAQPMDVRRFRPNILIDSRRGVAFEEDEWVGGILSFGEAQEGPAVSITNWDERCSMVNLDPSSASRSPQVLKAIVGVRGNKAGVYGSVLRRGRVAKGQPVFLEPAGTTVSHRDSPMFP